MPPEWPASLLLAWNIQLRGKIQGLTRANKILIQDNQHLTLNNQCLLQDNQDLTQDNALLETALEPKWTAPILFAQLKKLQARLERNEQKRAKLEATLNDCMAKLAGCRNALVTKTNEVVASNKELELLHERDNQLLALSKYLEENGTLEQMLKACSFG